MTGSPKVVVVGAGIVGASIAYHLALAGARVTLVERDAAASEATAGSFAWINASAGNASPYYELRLQGLLEWRALADSLGAALPLRWGGSLEWRVEASGLKDGLEAEVREQAARGYAVRMVGRDEIRALEPALAEPPEAAAFACHEGTVDPLGATAALVAAGVGLGVELRRGEAAALTVEAGRAAARLGGTALAADAVVLAVGTGSEAAAASLGVALPMANRPGLLIHCAPHAPLLGRLVLSPGAHMKQDPDGRIVAGEDFGGGEVLDGAQAAAEGARLLARVKRRLIGAEALALEHVTLGTRPIPRDGLPALGFAEELGGLYIATMHSGITLAPVVGRLVAAEIVDGQPLDLLEPYRPARFHVG